MTHDELLTMTWVIDNKIMSDQEHHGKMAKAVRAVVELHKPFVYEGRFEKYERCSGCASEEEFLGNLYPCPTIQAIVKGMDS